MELIKCEGVYKKLGDKNILENINLTITDNKIIGLLGKNGVGKTTLIKLINGLLTVDSGKITVLGEEIGVFSKNAISYLPERNYLDKGKSIKDTLSFWNEFYDNFDIKKARKLLKDLSLREDEKLSKMSKGNLDKLSLILVMSRKAKIYILDEPLGGVDPATRDYILDTILNNFEDGSSVIISTHLISDIEKILDEVIFIDNGKIILKEDADEIRKKENSSIDEVFRRRFKC